MGYGEPSAWSVLNMHMAEALVLRLKAFTASIGHIFFLGMKENSPHF
jgi:hypothetical protein